MDLMTLNANNQADKLIENYDSLIWTERYTIGDFQLTSGDVAGFKAALPKGSIVTLRETDVPMIVETHLIERKKNQPEKITIMGRDFCSILDRRIALSAFVGGAIDWTVNAKTPADVAYYIIDQICRLGILDAADIFPAAQVQFVASLDYNTSTGPSRAFTIPKGNLLTAVLTLLQTVALADATTTPATPAVVAHGIKAIRPTSAGTANAIQIYVGQDKYDTIYFDATRDLLDDGTYLFSDVGSANTAVALGPTSAVMVNGTGAAVSGMDRRVILVDGTTSGSTTPAPILEHAKMSLTEAHVTAAFDGSINQDLSPYRYGADYKLGDLVKLVGDYGMTSKARVTEYIRSEDATGVKAYPTLVTVA